MDKLFDIIHEDAELLVVNKPADLVCHPTKGDALSSLISRARVYLGNEGTPRLVNRLDRETSGVTIIAKTPEVAGELGRVWETRAVEKQYLAIVHGHLSDETGVINGPLGKDENSRVAIKDCVRPDGAPAQTEFTVLKRFERAEGTFSSLRVVPRTGRKHQIRIHLAHLGFPIVGDKLYGADEDLYLALVERRLSDEQRRRLLLPNHALHASAVRFFWREHWREFRGEPESWFLGFQMVGC
ncbi:MAG TPA: RluA family pseudouridine synthase [Verrucomicrobiae bacterium]|nr:RluA family pseudouridine synthase [Verrucomicrobiae bacterium]